MGKRGRPRKTDTSVVGVRLSNGALDGYARRAARARVPLRSVLRRTLEEPVAIHRVPERALPEHDSTDVVDVAIAILIRDNRTYTPDDLRELLKRRAEMRSYTTDYWARQVEEHSRQLREAKRLLAQLKQKQSAEARHNKAVQRAEFVKRLIVKGIGKTEAVRRWLSETDPAFDSLSEEHQARQIDSAKRNIRVHLRKGGL